MRLLREDGKWHFVAPLRASSTLLLGKSVVWVKEGIPLECFKSLRLDLGDRRSMGCISSALLPCHFTLGW